MNHLFFNIYFLAFCIRLIDEKNIQTTLDNIFYKYLKKTFNDNFCTTIIIQKILSIEKLETEFCIENYWNNVGYNKIQQTNEGNQYFIIACFIQRSYSFQKYKILTNFFKIF